MSVLLVVTNFLARSAVVLVDDADLTGADTGFLWATGLAGAAFFAGFAGTALATFFFAAGTLLAAATFFFAAGFAGAAFFGAGLAAAFFTGADLAAFFTALAAFGLAAGFDTLRAGFAAARTTGFARTAGFAVFALLPAFALLLAITQTHLVTRRSRVIA